MEIQNDKELQTVYKLWLLLFLNAGVKFIFLIGFSKFFLSDYCHNAICFCVISLRKLINP